MCISHLFLRLLMVDWIDKNRMSQKQSQILLFYYRRRGKYFSLQLSCFDALEILFTVTRATHKAMPV